MDFPCTGCGACCKRIEKAVNYVKQFNKKELDFPYSWDENGACEKLGDDGKCGVYDDRPTLCRVDEMEKYFDMSREEYFDWNINSCNQMIEEDGLKLLKPSASLKLGKYAKLKGKYKADSWDQRYFDAELELEGRDFLRGVKFECGLIRGHKKQDLRFQVGVDVGTLIDYFRGKD